MARIAIDTSGGTTTTVKAAFDDINTMTTELYALLGNPGNMVTLGTQGLRRTTAYTGAPAAATYMTFAARFTCPVITSTSHYPTILGDNDIGTSGVYIGFYRGADNNHAALSMALTSGAGQVLSYGSTFETSPGVPLVLTAGTTYTVHVAASAPNTVQVWVNGALLTSPTAWATTAANINFSTMADASVCCGKATDANLTFTNGQIGFVWVGAGTTADWYITDPSKFYNATTPSSPPYLSPAGQTPNNLQPMLFMGGTHLVDEWRAGTNFGYGGDFVLGTG
jgi:hypothetical protein